MRKDWVLTQQQFDDLLNWLSADREKAGEIYLSVSEGLTRYFRMKGCSDPPSLVDKTINLVARKISRINVSGSNKPITIFYGFAKNVYFEYLAEARRAPVSVDPERLPDRRRSTGVAGSDPRFNCLDSCVNGLKERETHLVMAYFEKDRGEKVESRRELAQLLNISIGNLHVKIHRLKNTLRECLEDCLESL